MAELRRLAERLPLPHPYWHPYTDEMHVVVATCSRLSTPLQHSPR
jgi:hypothetical protein